MIVSASYVIAALAIYVGGPLYYLSLETLPHGIVNAARVSSVRLWARLSCLHVITQASLGGRSPDFEFSGFR